ncbi:MarR family transcriptional regulator [Anaerotignum sp.]
MSFRDEEIVGLFFDVMKMSRYFAKIHNGSSSPFLGQYRCIYTLNETGRISQKELAEILQIRSTSLSELLLKLEKKGLVERMPSAQDKRKLLVSLTQEGHEEALKYQKLRVNAYCDMVSPLSEEEKRQFYSILSKIKNHYMEMEEEGHE